MQLGTPNVVHYVDSSWLLSRTLVYQETRLKICT